MTPNPRAISKRLRFSIFERDNFTCRYCGKNSEEVCLEVDHIFPVSKGGGCEEHNLVTSCVDCNRGKADRILQTDAPQPDRLRAAQELREQTEIANASVEAVEARQRLNDSIIGYWCQCTNRKRYDIATLNTVCRYASDFGLETVLRWIDRAAAIRFNDDVNMGKYISGTRRKVLEETAAAAAR